MNLQAFNPNPDTTKQLEEQVYQVLTALGEDPHRPGLE